MACQDINLASPKRLDYSLKLTPLDSPGVYLKSPGKRQDHIDKEKNI